MSKIIKQHLESITAENLEAFKKDPTTFTTMASLHGRNGSFEIGVTGNGTYAVRHNGEVYFYSTPEVAVERYYRLLLDSEK